MSAREPASRPAALADQLWLMIDGALTNSPLIAGDDPHPGCC
jgi:hypothetical protein